MPNRRPKGVWQLSKNEQEALYQAALADDELRDQVRQILGIDIREAKFGDVITAVFDLREARRVVREAKSPAPKPGTSGGIKVERAGHRNRDLNQLVRLVRQHVKDGDELEQAIDAALDRVCPEDEHELLAQALRHLVTVN